MQKMHKPRPSPSRKHAKAQSLGAHKLGKRTPFSTPTPHIRHRHINARFPSGRGGSRGIIFTSPHSTFHAQTITRSPLYPPELHCHILSSEVLSPKTHTPANYQPIHVKNVLLHIPGHYAVMFERHMSHPPLHVRLLRLMPHSCVLCFHEHVCKHDNLEWVGTCPCTELFYFNSNIVKSGILRQSSAEFMLRSNMRTRPEALVSYGSFACFFPGVCQTKSSNQIY